MTEIVTVTAPQHRRRAGRSFGPHPVEIDRKDLTDAQFEALTRDPFLSVSVRTVDAEEVVAPAKVENSQTTTEPELKTGKRGK